MKIVSDGLIANTKITTDSGEVIDGVINLVIYGAGGDDFLVAQLMIRLSMLNVEIRDEHIQVFGVDTDEQLINLVQMQKNIRIENNNREDKGDGNPA
jgi:pectate lyase